MTSTGQCATFEFSSDTTDPPKQFSGEVKKKKSDYRKLKDSIGQSVADRTSWRWYDQVDVINGHRPASNWRESGLDSAMIGHDELAEDVFSFKIVFSLG